MTAELSATVHRAADRDGAQRPFPQQRPDPRPLPRPHCRPDLATVAIPGRYTLIVSGDSGVRCRMS